MKKILSFDASSSTIGYAVLEIDDGYNINFISVDYIKPIKHENIIERLAHTRNKIETIIEKIKPDYIGIEQIVSFMQGKSTANTIITLTAFNRMICLSCYDYLNKVPELFNVMSIRHALKLNKVFPKKSDMPALVSKHLGIKFPYEYNKKGKAKVENEDMADAIAVGLYYAFVLTGKLKKKKK